MLYTRKGDTGTTELFGSPDRLPKDCPLFEALGTVDELNSLLGICFAKANRLADMAAKESAAAGDSPEAGFRHLAELVRDAQQDLFIVQAELGGARKTLDHAHVLRLEALIAEVESQIENPHSFVIAGGSELSAYFDYARAVSRRAERHVLAVRGDYPTSANTQKYLNRLSSFLYALARKANKLAESEEAKPTYL